MNENTWPVLLVNDSSNGRWRTVSDDLFFYTHSLSFFSIPSEYLSSVDVLCILFSNFQCEKKSFVCILCRCIDLTSVIWAMCTFIEIQKLHTRNTHTRARLHMHIPIRMKCKNEKLEDDQCKYHHATMRFSTRKQYMQQHEKAVALPPLPPSPPSLPPLNATKNVKE